MTRVPHEVNWLSDTEMRAWRSYVVATLMLRQRLHRELAEQHGISLMDYEVLVCLSSTPENQLRMSELATMLGSTKSRLSHQVGRMETAGYVRRGKDPDDRRGVTAELTPLGLDVLRQTAPTHVEGVREHFIGLLTGEDMVVIDQAFSRVLTHLADLES